jgi:predicted alpha/beta hydrolase family esterase
MDHLADGPLERRVAGVFLIAAPFIGDGGWPSEGLRPTKQLALALHKTPPLYFYQGRDDETVPVSHIEMFATAFPAATIRRLEGRNHQLNDDLSEVAHDITLLTVT